MASERYSYLMTEAALSDAEEAIDYISNELCNPEAASSFADELEEKLEEICRTPKAGRPVQNPYLRRSDVRRFLVKNYTAYYIINEDKIIVLRIVYSKRNQDTVLRDLGSKTE